MIILTPFAKVRETETSNTELLCLQTYQKMRRKGWFEFRKGDNKYQFSSLFAFFDSGSCTRNRFYTHTHPPLKPDEKCRQKAELGFAGFNFQNLYKKYSAYGVRTK